MSRIIDYYVGEWFSPFLFKPIKTQSCLNDFYVNSLTINTILYSYNSQPYIYNKVY